VHEPEEVLDVIVETRRHAAEVLKPGVQPLDLPPALVAPQLPPVLRPRLLPVRAVRRDQFDATFGEFGVEGCVAGNILRRQKLLGAFR
jgi:hypothetical protein